MVIIIIKLKALNFKLRQRNLRSARDQREEILFESEHFQRSRTRSQLGFYIYLNQFGPPRSRFKLVTRGSELGEKIPSQNSRC